MFWQQVVFGEHRNIFAGFMVWCTRVGYAQGNLENPTYQQVKAQISGHAEVCEIVYEDQIISLESLLQHYFSMIDPTLITNRKKMKAAATAQEFVH